MDVHAEITANVWQVRTEVGATVAEGDELMILESMKMETAITAPAAGTIAKILVAPGKIVQAGQALAILLPSPEEF